MSRLTASELYRIYRRVIPDAQLLEYLCLDLPAIRRELAPDPDRLQELSGVSVKIKNRVQSQNCQ